MKDCFDNKYVNFISTISILLLKYNSPNGDYLGILSRFPNNWVPSLESHFPMCDWMQSNILKGPKKDEMQMALETFTVEKMSEEDVNCLPSLKGQHRGYSES